MKVLTAAQMGAIDRATIESGIPGIILMENAASRVVEFIAERFSPVSEQRIVIVCGKGNNGGDGLAIARLLHIRFSPRVMYVVLTCDPEDLRGDAAQNLAMLRASGVQEYRDFGPEMRAATLVVDAVLGTGLKGAVTGPALDAIVQINSFKFADIIAVDLPSGLSGDSGQISGEYVRADATVTFTAPKLCHALPPACDLMGELRIAPIGTPDTLFESNSTINLSLITSEQIAHLFAPRAKDSNKGKFGHVLLVAGSRGKSGAAAMAGVAALRAGAGLVTVASSDSVIDAVAAYAPELMTEEADSADRVSTLAEKRSLVAIGPGIGTADSTSQMVRKLFAEIDKPMIVDADGLNCLAGTDWKGSGHLRVLTPHPGEMSRLTNRPIPEIQADRIASARALATERNVIVVLKGERTLIAFPDGRVSINPTGSPAMATGGTGDILTGIIAGLMAQFPHDAETAISAAVYLHGLAGELAANDLTEQVVIATDLLTHLPEAIREITYLPDPL
jgi:hydroxyethylthiazole kinase-like uncharacterized protein yjeF